MLKKFAYILIGLSVAVLLVVLGFNLLLNSSTPYPELDRVPDLTTTRDTESGTFVGFIDRDGARAWLGIPYAQPPVDELRWKAPLPPNKKPGITHALSLGNPCVQFASIITPPDARLGINNTWGSEDCLFLNIWSSPNSHQAPVMLWLHGGGNSVNSGGTENGATLAATQNVVVVTMNYRLGVLGWLYHPRINNGSPEDLSGNFGTLDVIQALHWIRNNIDTFGGNPNNITVFGESAGARNTAMLLASPLAKGLFHRAIMQSGGLWMTSKDEAFQFVDEGGNPHSSQEVINRLLMADESANNLEQAKAIQGNWNDDELREYMYEKNAAELLSIFTPSGFSMYDFVDHIQDGYVLPDLDPSLVFMSQENYNEMPVIVGTNRDEVSLFMFQDPRHVSTFLWVFNSFKNEADYRKEVYYGSALWKAVGVDNLAELMYFSGNRNIYTYRFDWDELKSLMGFDLSTAIGAGHIVEINFVFGQFDRGIGAAGVFPNDTAQENLSDAMMSYWTEFASTGNPGKGQKENLPQWTAWRTGGDTSIVFDSEADSGIRMIDSIVSVEGLRQAFLADEDFSSLEAKCRIYDAVFTGFRQANNNDKVDLGCPETPLLMN